MNARQKWEYEFFSAEPETDTAGFDEKLNKRGEQGWELVGIVSDKQDSTNFFIFKRPKG
jgi:hypothetical protein